MRTETTYTIEFMRLARWEDLGVAYTDLNEAIAVVQALRQSGTSKKYRVIMHPKDEVME